MGVGGGLYMRHISIKPERVIRSGSLAIALFEAKLWRYASSEAI